MPQFFHCIQISNTAVCIWPPTSPYSHAFTTTKPNSLFTHVYWVLQILNDFFYHNLTYLQKYQKHLCHTFSEISVPEMPFLHPLLHSQPNNWPIMWATIMYVCTPATKVSKPHLLTNHWHQSLVGAGDTWLFSKNGSLVKVFTDFEDQVCTGIIKFYQF